jgi:hypothetical protein
MTTDDIEKGDAALPHGHPERWVKFPNGVRKKWKDVTDEDRAAAEQMIAERYKAEAEAFEAVAKIHEDAAKRLREHE